MATDHFSSIMGGGERVIAAKQFLGVRHPHPTSRLQPVGNMHEQCACFQNTAFLFQVDKTKKFRRSGHGHNSSGHHGRRFERSCSAVSERPAYLTGTYGAGQSRTCVFFLGLLAVCSLQKPLFQSDPTRLWDYVLTVGVKIAQFVSLWPDSVVSLSCALPVDPPPRTHAQSYKYL